MACLLGYGSGVKFCFILTHVARMAGLFLTHNNNIQQTPDNTKKRFLFCIVFNKNTLTDVHG